VNQLGKSASAFVAVTLFLSIGCTSDPTPNREGAPSKGSERFDTRFLSLSGDSLPLFDASGRITVIHVGAAACELCLSTIPIVEALGKSYPDSVLRPLVVLMDPSSDRAGVDRLARTLSGRFTVLLDPEQRIRSIVSLLALPGMVVLDRNGVVRLKYPGQSTSLAPMVDSAVRNAVSAR
jgi:thiol-disulfide isomerase/thioredoxin